MQGLEVQSTLAGSAADGVVAAGDQLVRVGIHDVRHWAAGKGPKPMEVSTVHREVPTHGSCEIDLNYSGHELHESSANN